MHQQCSFWRSTGIDLWLELKPLDHEMHQVIPTLKDHITHVAQFIAVCRRSKVVSTGTRRHRRGPRLCRRCALPQRGDTPRLRQILRATNGDKLSDPLLLRWWLPLRCATLLWGE